MTILCALPAYGHQVYLPFHRSYLAMARRCQSAGIDLSELYMTNTFVSHAREVGAATVISDTRFSHLLCMDADVGFPPEILQRLIAAKKDIVAGVYPRRALGQPKFIVSFFGGEATSGMVELENGFAKAKRVGAGMLLIRRSVLEDLAAKYPELKYTEPGIPHALYEFFRSGVNETRTAHQTDDTGFCELARKAGYTIWADLHSPMTHTGPLTVDHGSYLEAMDDTKLRSANR